MPPALARIGSIGAERADLMLPGCAIFAAICSLWPSPVLRVADRGLREGMLRRLAAGIAMRIGRCFGARPRAGQGEEGSRAHRIVAQPGCSASSTIPMSPRRGQRLSQPRRLQAGGTGREIPLPEKGRAGAGSGRGAGRLEPGGRRQGRNRGGRRCAGDGRNSRRHLFQGRSDRSPMCRRC